MLYFCTINHGNFPFFQKTFSSLDLRTGNISRMTGNFRIYYTIAQVNCQCETAQIRYENSGFTDCGLTCSISVFLPMEKGGQTPSFQTVEKASQNFPHQRKTKLEHFASGRVPDAKYISGCKCGICLLLADKLCTQQTAKNWRKAPKGDFRHAQRRANALL